MDNKSAITLKYYTEGDVIQNFLMNESTYFYDCVEHSITVLIVSTKCRTCLDTLNDLQEISITKNKLIVFIECDQKEYSAIQAVFNDRLNIFQINHAFLVKKLKARGVPWVYVINEDFTIVKSSIYQSKHDLISAGSG